MIGMYADDDRGGGTSGEFAIRWLHVGGRQVPRLEVFDDAWNALTRFDDLLKWLASVDGRNVTPRQVADALVSMGVKDMTQRDEPDGRNVTPRQVADALVSMGVKDMTQRDEPDGR